MKKKNVLFALAISSSLFSCTGNPDQHGDGDHRPVGDTLAPVQSVSLAEGNEMLQSYLTSINYQQNDTQLHSLIFNADSLRSYLNDTTHGKIRNVKIMLSHTLNYARGLHKSQDCGYKVGGLTVIIAGYDASNNYIYDKNQRVVEQGIPCPTMCPKSGSAASDLLR